MVPVGGLPDLWLFQNRTLIRLGNGYEQRELPCLVSMAQKFSEPSFMQNLRQKLTKNEAEYAAHTHTRHAYPSI